MNAPSLLEEKKIVKRKKLWLMEEFEKGHHYPQRFGDIREPAQFAHFLPAGIVFASGDARNKVRVGNC